MNSLQSTRSQKTLVYIAHYWCMPPKIGLLLHVYCSLNLDPTLLYVQQHNQKIQLLIYHAITINVPITNMSSNATYMPHAKLLNVHQLGSILIYMQHVNSLVSTKLWTVLYTEGNDANSESGDDVAWLIELSMALANSDKTSSYMIVQGHMQTDNHLQFYRLWFDKAKSVNNSKSVLHQPNVKNIQNQ